MGNWQAVGSQKFLVEDDTVHWNVCGNVSGHELTTIFEEGFRVQNTHGYTLFSITIIGDWGFPPEARQALAQFHRTHETIGASAIVGISAKTAMFIDVVLRGVGKVSGRRPKTRFFSTTQEAAAWLSEERAQLRESLHTHKK